MDSDVSDTVTAVAVLEAESNGGSAPKVVKGERKKHKDYDLKDFVKTDVNSLVPCFAFCCFFHSCFIQDNCWRCTVTQEACCCTTNLIICMPYLCIKSESELSGNCCLITEGICGLHEPETCIKAEYQVMCCDVRVAFPLDSEFQPCLFTILGWTCCFDYEFMACTEVIIAGKKMLLCCQPLDIMKKSLAEAKESGNVKNS